MSTDYSKKKNDELQELLKSRSLPHTGKKAELIARLQQDDTEKAAATSKPAKSTTQEDEIDWEDDAAAASTTAGAAAIAAGGQTQPPNPTAVPNQSVATDPSQTKDLKTDPPAPAALASADTSTTGKTDTAEAEPQSFASNLPTTTLDDELAKRKARAARFGLAESDSDALKALERAKKFGGATTGEKESVKGLDEALPERRLKRGRGGGETKEGAGARQGKRSRTRGDAGGDGGSWLNDTEKAKAEARKKRFG